MLTKLAIAVVLATPLGAQATVHGTVFDSVTGKPLTGAVVTVVNVRDPASTARSATSDSVGRYAINDVKPGAYVIGFIHPTLDSLGLEPITRRITTAAAPLLANLAVPSGRSIHDTFCKASDTTGALIGHLRDATSQLPVDGGKVIAQWSQIGFANGQLARTLPTYVVTTNAEGWFAVCGVPVSTSVAVQGVSGTDSTGTLMIEVPAHGVLRRELFTSKAEIVATTPVDSVPVEHLRRGTGRVTGVARDAASGKPLGGVQLTVAGTGISTTANDAGMFTLANLPLGTQTLLARKVGYVPDERAVDLLANTPASAEPSLVTIKALLDTVKVVGKRVYSSDRNGFNRRFKAGTGRYFDADMIDKIHPFQTSDLFNRVLSVKVVQNGFDRVISMRGVFKGACTPNVYVDGFPYRSFTASDLDNMVRPEAVAGIEIYDSPAQAPAQYSNPFSECGSIVIWTKR
ncbi:MAG: TonB-dependent receptor plug [Gemmatimonadetes bacterium]|nr:TonB-dependent receptor plug [Gemmatimonadota bacterium]